ncbi:MAG TPA: type I-B CRISPR-associated protein Cas5 [Aquificae bacterium]|nr:type I-B CRISPR-associated protein Cas5 [Aquificota bacterium]
MIRVKLTSWTATFRYPTFQSGYQPTLSLPPLSTILGLLSAAKGDIVSLNDIEFIGYIFKSLGKGKDLEKTYMLGEKIKSDVIKREILFNNTLYLYLPDEWEKYFKKPRYQLLLGRSCDLVAVKEIKPVNLEKKENVPIAGTIVPLEANLSGKIQALPVEFDYSDIPRKVKIVRPFVLLPYPKDKRKIQIYEGKLPYDSELGLGVWFYDKSLLS